MAEDSNTENFIEQLFKNVENCVHFFSNIMRVIWERNFNRENH